MNKKAYLFSYMVDPNAKFRIHNYKVKQQLRRNWNYFSAYKTTNKTSATKKYVNYKIIIILLYITVGPAAKRTPLVKKYAIKDSASPLILNFVCLKRL